MEHYKLEMEIVFTGHHGHHIIIGDIVSDIACDSASLDYFEGLKPKYERLRVPIDATKIDNLDEILEKLMATEGVVSVGLNARHSYTTLPYQCKKLEKSTRY